MIAVVRTVVIVVQNRPHDIRDRRAVALVVASFGVDRRGRDLTTGTLLRICIRGKADLGALIFGTAGPSIPRKIAINRIMSPRAMTPTSRPEFTTGKRECLASRSWRATSEASESGWKTGTPRDIN